MKNKKIYVLAAVGILAIIIHIVFFGFDFDTTSLGPVFIGLLCAFIVVVIGIKQNEVKDKENQKE